MSTKPATNADLATLLNDHLKSGGMVQVTTYLRATRYTAKHSGWFFADSAGDLRVKSGRGSVILATPRQMMVDIRRFGEPERFDLVADAGKRAAQHVEKYPVPRAADDDTLDDLAGTLPSAGDSITY